MELVSPVLLRALEPFPKPVRTLDALHLRQHRVSARAPTRDTTGDLGRRPPFANIALITDPEKNILVIMKDGKIYKNLLRD